VRARLFFPPLPLSSIYIWSENSSPKRESKMAEIEELLDVSSRAHESELSHDRLDANLSGGKEGAGYIIEVVYPCMSPLNLPTKQT
jgi:hypothetical protein